MLSSDHLAFWGQLSEIWFKIYQTVGDNVTRLRFCEGINRFSLELINAPWDFSIEVNKSLPGNSDQSQPRGTSSHWKGRCTLVVSLFPLLTRLKQHASPQRFAPLALSTQATIPIFPPSLPFQLFYIFNCLVETRHWRCSVTSHRGRTGSPIIFNCFNSLGSLSGVPDYFDRNKISSGGDLSHYSSASLY